MLDKRYRTTTCALLLLLAPLVTCSGNTPSPSLPPDPPTPGTASSPLPPTTQATEPLLIQAPTKPGTYGIVLERPDGGSSLPYSILIPNGYSPEQPAPLVLALHYGWNGARPPQFYGGGLISGLVQPGLGELGAIVVAPDCPDQNWTSPKSHDVVLELLSYIQQVYSIDQQRVLLVGYSLGAEGVWKIVASNPGTFSAGIPISGLPRSDLVDQVEHTPLYVIHSRQDELFPFDAVEAVVQKMQAQRARVQLAVVEGFTHYQVEGFVPALRDAVPWIRQVWGD